MPKVKKKYAGGNPLLLARFGLFVKNIINDPVFKDIYKNIKNNNPKLLDELKEKLTKGDITGIINILETNEETKKVLENPNIKQIIKIIDKIPLDTINNIISTLSSKVKNNNQEVNNTEKTIQEVNNTGKSNQEVNNTGKSNQEINNTGKSNQEVNNTGKSNQEINNTGKSNQEVNNTGKSNPEINNTGKSNPEINNTGKSNPEINNTGKSNPEINNTGKSNPEFNENNSLYIKIAIFLKGITRVVIYVVSIFVEYVIYKPLSSFLPALLKFLLHIILDIWQFVAILVFIIIIVLVVSYLLSGGAKRKPNNTFDSLLGGFSKIFIPTIPNYENDDFYEDDTIGTFNNIGDVFNGNIFTNTLRLFMSNPGIDNINDDDKELRIQKKEGRCDNKNQIESKDGRYCYEQLTKKHIEWDNKEIQYKLLENKNMKEKNNHLDYYVPNCKGSNIFTKEYIASCKDSRRTKFICKI
jgi:hypothetical protein